MSVSDHEYEVEHNKWNRPEIPRGGGVKKTKNNNEQTYKYTVHYDPFTSFGFPAESTSIPNLNMLEYLANNFVLIYSMNIH